MRYGARRPQTRRGDSEIEFSQRSKKYRTKYMSALKQLFSTAKEGTEDEGEVSKGFQAKGSDTEGRG